MKSSGLLTDKDPGRAIARALDDIHVQKQKNMVKAEKRRATMVKTAAEESMFQ